MTPIFTQIRIWLMQPKVWRCMGFVSAVIGLLCYALSSSFNHLFGEWNLLKIFLYIVFSFIICLLILYAKIWEDSRSLQLKAHTAFLVLTITSVYSFFSDKVMNGKPDAYSLISCAAFAIMSLSMSRQTRCGFEVDLLYFFLGCLIVQLMKIKLQLRIVGAGFSYSLIILRSSFSSRYASGENQYHGLQDENSVVIEVDSHQPLASTNIASMMEQLRTCVKVLQQENSNLMDKLSVQVKEFLEEDKSELEVTDYNFMIDALPPETIKDLHETAKLMVSIGLEKEFSDVYNSWRRGFLEECLINKLFGLQEINIENQYERMEYVDMVIRRWITASEVALRILFPIERRLYDHVFSGFSSAATRCFKEVCQGTTSQLLNFADAVATGSPSMWRLLKMVAIFETLHYLIPKLQSLFPDPFVIEATAVKNRVGEATRELFMALNFLIFRIPSAKKVAPVDGQCHPMTAQVMSYLASICRSQQTLEHILHEYPKIVDGVGLSFSFTVQIERIMVLLERKLIEKSKKYKDPALRYFFMMNNRRHIEAMDKIWQLGTIFGNDWFRKNQAKTQQDLELYQRSSWSEVMDSPRLDNNESVESNDNVTEELLKDKLNLFNRHFEEISRVQSTWCVYDNKLKEEIITSVGNMLLPAYGVFIGRLKDFLGNQAYNYIAYGMFEIQDRLNNLFLGNNIGDSEFR